MEFYPWLIQQVQRTDIVGELASRVRGMANWPQTSELQHHQVFLARLTATPRTCRALAQAWEEWVHVRDLPPVNSRSFRRLV